MQTIVDGLLMTCTRLEGPDSPPAGVLSLTVSQVKFL